MKFKHQNYLIIISILALLGIYFFSFEASLYAIILSLISSLYFLISTFIHLKSTLKNNFNKFLRKTKFYLSIFFLSLIIANLNFFGIFYGASSIYTEIFGTKSKIQILITNKYYAGSRSRKEISFINLETKEEFKNINTSNRFYKSVNPNQVLDLEIKNSFLGTKFIFR